MIEQLLRLIKEAELLRAQMVVEQSSLLVMVDMVLNDLYWLHKELVEYE